MLVCIKQEGTYKAELLFLLVMISSQVQLEHILSYIEMVLFLDRSRMKVTITTLIKVPLLLFRIKRIVNQAYIQ